MPCIAVAKIGDREVIEIGEVETFEEAYEELRNIVESELPDTINLYINGEFITDIYVGDCLRAEIDSIVELFEIELDCDEEEEYEKYNE